jgi:hypothetical protein
MDDTLLSHLGVVIGRLIHRSVSVHVRDFVAEKLHSFRANVKRKVAARARIMASLANGLHIDDTTASTIGVTNGGSDTDTKSKTKALLQKNLFQLFATVKRKRSPSQSPFLSIFNRYNPHIHVVCLALVPHICCNFNTMRTYLDE